MSEADAILWLGLLVGLAGLATTAANGVALFIKEQLVPAKRRVAQGLARTLGRPGPTVRTITGIAKVGVSALSATASGTRTVSSDAPVQEQLDAIRYNLASLTDRVGELAKTSQERHGEVSQRVDSVTAELRENIGILTTRMNAEERDRARTDARGLWPVAFGFVMVAIPAKLASVSGLGATVTLAALFVTAAVARTVFEETLDRSVR